MRELSTWNIEITEGLIEAMEDHIEFACCVSCNTYMLESECVRGGAFDNAYCPKCAKSLDLTNAQYIGLQNIANTLGADKYDALVSDCNHHGMERISRRLERQTELLQSAYDMEPVEATKGYIQDMWLRNDTFIEAIQGFEELGIIQELPPYEDLLPTDL